MYVVNANYPGGMDAYLAKYVNVWYQTLSTASPITANLLGDGLMVRMSRYVSRSLVSNSTSLTRYIAAT